MENKIKVEVLQAGVKIDVSEMGSFTIENKDGFVIIAPTEKPIKEDPKYPEKGYFLNRVGTIKEIEGNRIVTGKQIGRAHV